MEVSQAQEAKQSRDENTRLRKFEADESGQGSAAIGDSKKRLELVALKAAVGQMQQEYAFSQRRLGRRRTKNGRWTSCTMRWAADGPSGY
jgi:hypothetical protein